MAKKLEQKGTISAILVQMARLGLSAKRVDVVAYVRKASRQIDRIDPDLAAELRALVSPSQGGGVVRRATPIPLPTDQETRLELLRCESPVLLAHEPLLPPVAEQTLRTILAERERVVELHEAGLQPTRTLLLTGPPGVGKTLTARWLANHLNLPLYTLDLAAVMSSFLGRTGNNIRAVMDCARREPAILLLDEFDAIAKRRDDEGELGELKRLVTVLLQAVDDWPASGLLVAATNHPRLLDPAVWRRFERQIDLPLPDAEAVGPAVRYFLGEAASSLEQGVEVVLSVVLVGRSYAEIEREILAARRDAIVREITLSQALLCLVDQYSGKLSKDDRIGLALALKRQSKLSQRRVSELTGVHRDTIRKYANANAITD